MHVGVCRILLTLPENQSLKGKRQVVRSLTERIRQRFNVSVAEIEDNDLWQRATLGVSCVSNDPRHANEVLSHVVAFIENSKGDLELADYQVEILPGL